MTYAHDQEAHRDALTMERWSIIGAPVSDRREFKIKKGIQDDLDAAFKEMSLQESKA